MADIIIYNTNDGKAAIKLYADNGTVWLTQAQIAELFNKERSGISKHIKNIFNEGELEEKSNVNFLHIANSDKPVAFYSLDVILAVGFRVRSPRGTQFRQWANNTLKEYLQKGFILDKDRLKNPDGRPDYFDELLEQIRDIRASVDKLLLDHSIPLLQSHGKISMDEAKAHARLAYETFDARRKAFEAAQADTIDLLELEQEAKSVKK